MRPYLLCIIVSAVFSLNTLLSYVRAEPVLEVNSPAKFIYMLDANSGAVLMNKNADARMYPASMTKIMTAYIALEQLKEGLITLDDEVFVSEKANRMGGSRMFIEQGKNVRLEDILRGIIVQSGNDASVALAEFLAGDERNFAAMMNNAAAKLGMTGSNFVNASGWPDENHYTTAKDLAILSDALIAHHPEMYRLFAEKTFTFSKITQKNRNPLLGKGGVDGIKTGFTKISGYGLASSAVVNDRRLILVLNGLTSQQSRASESQRLLNFAFRSTATRQLFTAGEEVTKLPLWYGINNRLPVAVVSDISFTSKKNFFDQLRFTASYQEPLRAPINKGRVVGQLHIHSDETIFHSVDLIALEDIDSKGFLERFQSNINYLLWGETP